jgi:hypothetical protein
MNLLHISRLAPLLFVLAEVSCFSVIAIGEARTTARIANYPPVDLDVAVCSGISTAECRAELADQFRAINQFWRQRVGLWAGEGLGQDEEGRELIGLAVQMTNASAKAYREFVKLETFAELQGEDDGNEILRNNIAHHSARYSSLLNRMRNIADARLRFKSNDAQNDAYRRGKMIENYQGMGVKDGPGASPVEMSIHNEK